MVVDPVGGVTTIDVDTGNRDDRLVPLAPNAEIGANASTVEPVLGPCGDAWCVLLDGLRLGRYRLDDEGDLDWFRGAPVDMPDCV